MAAISGVTPTTTSTTGKTAVGAQAMTSSDFLNLMITQLQQQDPLNPTDSNQLLTQLSQISTLQSNTAMTDSLSNLTVQQSIGAAGNLIGKAVTGLDSSGNQLRGNVTSVAVQNKQVFLSLDSGSQLPLENVTNIAAASASTLSSLASSLPQLQQLLAGAGTGSGGGSAIAGGASAANLLSLLANSGTGGAGASSAASLVNALSGLGLK